MAEMHSLGSHQRTLIFCPTGKGNDEGDEKRRWIDQYLDSLIRTNPTVRFAKVTGESANRSGILQTFEEGEELDALLSMKVLDEGLDIPSIRNAVLVASSSVHREHIQRRGRIQEDEPRDW